MNVPETLKRGKRRGRCGLKMNRDPSFRGVSQVGGSKRQEAKSAVQKNPFREDKNGVIKKAEGGRKRR